MTVEKDGSQRTYHGFNLFPRGYRIMELLSSSHLGQTARVIDVQYDKDTKLVGLVVQFPETEILAYSDFIPENCPDAMFLPKATLVGPINEMAVRMLNRDMAVAEANAARRKRLAAERKKKEAEVKVQLAKEQAEEQAKAAAERARIRAACATIYRNTASQKVSNLTVDEEHKVRTCQALGMYLPQ
jgi:hypothetical protein